MANLIYRIAPCPNYDVEHVECWLQDMARNGWMLDGEKSFLDILAFRKTEPQDIRYRLEPKPKGVMDADAPAQDMQDMCREYGWEFVRHFDFFFIYRAVSPDAREMNTDTEIQAVSLKSVKRQALWRIAYLILLWSNNMIRYFTQAFRFLLTHGPLHYFGVLSLILWGLCEVVIRAVHIHRLQTKLRDHTPLDHEKPWKKGATFHRISKVFWWVFYLFLLAYLITSCTANLADGSKMEDYTSDPPFVTMMDLCEAKNAVYTILNPTLSNAVTEDSNILAPTYMEWREYADITTPDGSVIHGQLNITYCETVSPWLARGMAEDLLEYDEDRHPGIQYLDVPELDADYAVAYTILTGASPTIILQQGNTVIQATVDLTNEAGESLFLDWVTMQLARMHEKT